MTDPDWDTLPCGNEPERLLSLAADETSPEVGSHEATCPYCRATIAELTDMWRPVRSWATRDIELPDRFVTTVMSRVRRLVQSPRHAVAVSARGTTTVTSWVLGLIASRAANNTPGVAAITGTPSLRTKALSDRYGADGVAIDEVGARDIAVTVGLTAAISPGSDVVELADAVRANIIKAISNEAGVVVAGVDIAVDDVELEPPT